MCVYVFHANIFQYIDISYLEIAVGNYNLHNNCLFIYLRNKCVNKYYNIIHFLF